mmetsp:Transcript_16137/g.52887  ORF Transcript_16137/g.52887 Transcript_16137/m.52887 type:complete len:573 (-) Transcript_16137:305-2023(-)
MSLASSPALGPASGSGRCIAQLWDTRHAMLHALRRDIAEELPRGSRASICGASLSGGGGHVAVAFEDAVLVQTVPPHSEQFGLAHALNASARTAEALAPKEAALLSRAPLCPPPHVSTLLSDCSGGASDALCGGQARRGPQPVGEAELAGWCRSLEAGETREREVLAKLLGAGADADAFEGTLGRFLAALMEEAAARAAAEEGVASGSANGVLAASEAPSGEAPRSPGSGLKAGGRRKRRGKRATPEARAEPSEGRAAPKQLKCTAEALSRSAAAAGPAADRHNAGARAGASVAAALDGESQLSASRAGSHSRGALDVSAGFVAAVCNRCVEAGSARWLRLLRPLIEAGALSGGAHESQLLAALCDARELEMLLLYVRHSADLDAAGLLALLRLALHERKRVAAAPPPRPPPKMGESWEALLDLLVCAPRNDVFLLQALRWLSLEDALVLLSRLLELFSSYAGAWRLAGACASGPPLDDDSSSVRGGGGGGCTPMLGQLVGWTNVLLDAHASQLLMHAPAHDALQQLGKLARRHVQLCSAMKGLKGYVGQATLKQSRPIRPIPDYSLELLEM